MSITRCGRRSSSISSPTLSNSPSRVGSRSMCPQEDRHAVLRVIDTGTGIPRAELPRIFDRFHRVEGARGRTHEGTGIGLALVKELVGCTRARCRSRAPSAKAPRSRCGCRSAAPTFRRTASEPPAPRPRPRRAPRPLSAKRCAGCRTACVGGGVGKPRRAAPERAWPVKERARVLLADDNADMRDYLSRLLAPSYDVDGRRRRRGGAGGGAARCARPDPHRRHDAAARRLRAAAEAARRSRAAQRAGDRAVGARRRGSQGRGLAAGRRRLSRQAVQRPRTAGAGWRRTSSCRERARKARSVLHEEAQILELLNKVGTAVAAELDLERAVQVVTDAATELSGAAFGSFFYNVIDEKGEAYTLYTLSGAPREAFAKFPMPRNTAVFAPTFRGEGIVRSDDITKDPRYGTNAPYHGMPEGHLPVRSYLAVAGHVAHRARCWAGCSSGIRSRRVQRAGRAHRRGDRRAGRHRDRQGEALPGRAGRNRAAQCVEAACAKANRTLEAQGRRAHRRTCGQQRAIGRRSGGAERDGRSLPALRRGRRRLRDLYARPEAASSRTGIPGPSASRDIAAARSSASISAASTPTEDRAAGVPQRRSKPRRARASTRPRAGASARTARASGRAS